LKGRKEGRSRSSSNAAEKLVVLKASCGIGVKRGVEGASKLEEKWSQWVGGLGWRIAPVMKDLEW
jgi:hypothetical protein